MELRWAYLESFHFLIIRIGDVRRIAICGGWCSRHGYSYVVIDAACLKEEFEWEVKGLR